MPPNRQREGGPGSIASERWNTSIVREFTDRQWLRTTALASADSRTATRPRPAGWTEPQPPPSPAVFRLLHYEKAAGRRDIVPTAIVSPALSVCQPTAPSPHLPALHTTIIGGCETCGLKRAVRRGRTLLRPPQRGHPGSTDRAAGLRSRQGMTTLAHAVFAERSDNRAWRPSRTSRVIYCGTRTLTTGPDSVVTTRLADVAATEKPLSVADRPNS